MNKGRWLVAALAGLVLIISTSAWSARTSNVRQTKHNLSSSGSNAVKASSQTQVCVFCHTPHAATPNATPLWNRKLSTASYSVYTSSSLDAEAIAGAQLSAPGGSSKLCLSCHDGTLAIGQVNVLNGAGSDTTQGTQSISMTGTGTGGVMPDSAKTTGFTRYLGNDLTNDHPISVTYNKTLTDRDGELRAATQNAIDGTWEIVDGSTRLLGKRNFGSQGGAGQAKKPLMPLETADSQIQCATCHDPHTYETDATKGNQKFLRLNRFQEAAPSGTYSQTNDIICLSCHDKNQGNSSWAFSAHAHPDVANETYVSAAATTREFPSALPVWKAACLNCHDTHTVQGARRLLREGTDSVASPKTGGSPALEETCYQCHSSASTTITALTNVPAIKEDFALGKSMPITSTNQPGASEKHDIGSKSVDSGGVDCSTTTNKCGADFVEERGKLGVANLNNRHAECTDCHNPHRVIRAQNGLPGALSSTNTKDTVSGRNTGWGTHPHTDATGYTHTNVISGVLRGAWGVEPTYPDASFHSKPSGYTVKRGDPGSNTNTAASASYVTREYQICFKCHSDYGYSDNNTHPTGDRPTLGSFTGGTASGTNNLTQYTNQAKEFQAPAGHKGQVSAGTAAGAAVDTNNHRSWHPVMDSTGRTTAIRNANANNWNAPWNNAVGTQTMYCSDCHGSGIASGTYSVIPASGKPWGPHGSANDFLLKGVWNNATGSGQETTGLCFKCHSYSLYATRGGGSSGFGGSKDSNLHSYHADKLGKMRCNWCHVAVPHGWKNKALLVNLNDVGAEGGLASGTQVRNGTTAAYNRQPYYMNAINKIKTFATSGNWADSNCGSKGAPGNNTTGRSWMRDSNENCTNPP
ncbi:cytochrome c3 family protein [Denitratisoma oestradiolicum]|uniref:Doubled CXXCH motif domain-containing protein n=1 Tax=Denitratisoma oestradiolicum TaxID=311182 RepID=A0A6S6XSN2_9PROT|nr:cytochrome c3 family protein [Denitratisoma oestradiolicum]TWO80638.1 hypothetical protein CBW56_09390 [Denitratisoma oestradiolicum]CAB1367720.1 conserved exported protein of unknown function [Denitratisoma oestradiolicum]